MKRRDLLKAALALPAWRVTRARASTPSERTRVEGPARAAVRQARAEQPPASVDFVVVGSGAGGGTVAARLVEAGYSVLVLEAGGDPRSVDYDVPAFHPFATENESMRWDFFVHHYSNPDKERSDPKYIADKAIENVPRVVPSKFHRQYLQGRLRSFRASQPLIIVSAT